MPTRWTTLTPGHLLLAGLMMFALLGTACRSEPEAIEGAPREPVAAVEALAEALREGDLKRYARLSLPPALYARQQDLWRQKMAAADPVDDEQAQRFADLMQTLASPDAEAAIWAKAEPKLQALEQELGPKWTVGVTMLSGFATTAIESSEALSAPEKGHASGVVAALAAWAGDQARFTDRESAKRAIGIAVQTARELDLPTVEAARALDYEPMLDKAGVAFRGLKSVATAYGIDADAALAQVDAEVIALDGAKATVRVRYPLLGETVSFEQPMVQVDGGWYREDALAAVEKALAESPATVPSPVAAPAVAPTP